MSVRQWRAIGLAAFGLGAIVVGVGRQASSTIYPAGDWRGDPVISTIVNGAIALVGVVMIASAVGAFVRKRK